MESCEANGWGPLCTCSSMGTGGASGCSRLYPCTPPVLGTGPLLNGAGLLQEVERECAKELSSCSLPFMKKDPETLF